MRCFALPFFALMALSGCGGSNIVPVSGTVTYKGKPVANVQITFTPEEGRQSVGMTDSQGRFTLDYDRDTKGATVGKHKVAVMLPPGGGGGRPGQQDASADIKEVLEKYGPDKSKAEVTIDKNTRDVKLEWD
jgi:hypothetical protein